MFSIKYCNVIITIHTVILWTAVTIRAVTFLSQPQLSHWYLWCDVMLLTLGHKSPSKSSRPLSGVTTVWSVGLLGVWVCLSTDSRLKIVTNHTTGHSPYPGLQDGEHSSDTRKTRDHVWVLAAGCCPLRTPWSRPYVAQYSITSTTSSISPLRPAHSASLHSTRNPGPQLSRVIPSASRLQNIPTAFSEDICKIINLPPF